MADAGWLKLWRKIKDDEMWLEEPFTKGQAWVDLLLLANAKNNGAYKSGFVYQSKRQLADRWKWGRTKVNSFLNHLERKKMIKLKPKDNRIYITNWGVYQSTEKPVSQKESKKETAKKFHYEFINGERTMIIDADD